MVIIVYFLGFNVFKRIAEYQNQVDVDGSSSLSIAGKTQISY